MTDTPKPSAAPSGDTLPGVLWAGSAYLIWGVQPLFMKLVSHLPTAEVIAHRVIWSVPVAVALLIVMGRTGDIGRALRSPKTVAQAALAACVVSLNWGIYVWAIQVGRTVETSLGYYINPLVTILLAALVLGEKLNRAQIVSIVLAFVAVLVMTWDGGGLPLVSLALAGSWAAYAYLKRTLPIGPAQGFLLEILLLLPFALGYTTWLHATGRGHFFDNGGYEAMLFIGCGLITAIPLILYATGAKLLTLSTIGVMQYTAPTLVFLIAVFVFREPFGTTTAIAFALIWIALTIYTWSIFRGRRATSSR